MGLLDYFTGSGQAGWLKHGTEANVAKLYEGRNKAFNHLGSGYATAGDQLELARNNARNESTTGYNAGKQFLQGSHDEADRNLFEGFTNAGRFLSEGARGADEKLEGALSRVTDYYNPYIEAGNAAQSRYSDIMGLNGAEAAEAAYDSYYDPSREFRDQQILRAQNAASNAGGYLGSGRAGLASARALNESQYGDMQNYENRLERASQSGAQHAGNLSSITSNIMGQQAQNQTRYGEQLANNVNNLYGEQARADRQYGSTLDTNARGYFDNLGQIDLGLGGAQSKNTIEHHKALASLDQGTEATIGSLFNKEAQGIAAAKGAGANNVIGGITGVAKMFGGGLFG